MSPRPRSTFLALLGLVLLLAGSWAEAQLAPLPQDQGATGLGLALRRLPVSFNVLYVTAHPDDENNGVLTLLSRGQGVRTGLLTVTRGDGGQNEIGPELFQAIGILRTEELAGVHRYDAAEQYYTKAYEFGYSFSVEETLQKWGKEEILDDVVRVFRGFRPDVVLTLSLEGPGGGQHHQTTARLAKEAFRVAADPNRFPDQVKEGLLPWQALRDYQGGVGGGLERLEGEGQVLFRYVDAKGEPTPDSNPNGSRNNIAGIINDRGNVLGMMPHPERASEDALGSADGRGILRRLRRPWRSWRRRHKGSSP